MTANITCRQTAQDMLMAAMMTAFTKMGDAEIDPAVVKEAYNQVRRVEKLFGYDPGSWK